MRLTVLLSVCALAGLVMWGCSGGEDLKPEDSMSKTLLEAKKAQGVGDNVVSKNDMEKKKAPEKGNPPPSGK